MKIRSTMRHVLAVVLLCLMLLGCEEGSTPDRSAKSPANAGGPPPPPFAASAPAMLGYRAVSEAEYEQLMCKFAEEYVRKYYEIGKSDVVDMHVEALSLTRSQSFVHKIIGYGTIRTAAGGGPYVDMPIQNFSLTLNADGTPESAFIITRAERRATPPQRIGPIPRVKWIRPPDSETGVPPDIVSWIQEVGGSERIVTSYARGHALRLHKLDLKGCENVSDLSKLAGFTRWQALDLSGCSNISDLTPLADLTRLQALDLSGCPNVKDILPLASLTGCRKLDLSSTQVSDLSPLSGMRCLMELQLDSTPVVDLSPLTGMNNLYKVNLNYSQVSDLTPLFSLRDLKTVNFDSTPVPEEHGREFRQALYRRASQ